MDILILGAGSIGVYLGTLLYKKGHNVFLVGRNKLRKLHETILIGETLYKLPPRIYRLPQNSKFDFVFITSKLYDLENNLQKIQKNRIKTKYLISIQNGIVEKSIYEKYIPKIYFASISVYEGYRIIENQLFISPSRAGWKTDNSRAGKIVSEILQASGINCTHEKNLDSLKAEKTIMNCSINLLSAIKKRTFFELCNNKETKEIIDALFNESYEVLKQHYKLKPKEKLKKIFYDLVTSMKHYSSTYQDAISKRKTEIDFLNGFIVKMGSKSGIPTPENEKILKKFIKYYPKSK